MRLIADKLLCCCAYVATTSKKKANVKSVNLSSRFVLPKAVSSWIVEVASAGTALGPAAHETVGLLAS